MTAINAWLATSRAHLATKTAATGETGANAAVSGEGPLSGQADNAVPVREGAIAAENTQILNDQKPPAHHDNASAPGFSTEGAADPNGSFVAGIGGSSPALSASGMPTNTHPDPGTSTPARTDQPNKTASREATAGRISDLGRKICLAVATPEAAKVAAQVGGQTPAATPEAAPSEDQVAKAAEALADRLVNTAEGQQYIVDLGAGLMKRAHHNAGLVIGYVQEAEARRKQAEEAERTTSDEGGGGEGGGEPKPEKKKPEGGGESKPGGAPEASAPPAGPGGGGGGEVSLPADLVQQLITLLQGLSGGAGPGMGAPDPLAAPAMDPLAAAAGPGPGPGPGLGGPGPGAGAPDPMMDPKLAAANNAARMKNVIGMLKEALNRRSV